MILGKTGHQDSTRRGAAVQLTGFLTGKSLLTLSNQSEQARPRTPDGLGHPLQSSSRNRPSPLRASPQGSEAQTITEGQWKKRASCRRRGRSARGDQNSSAGQRSPRCLRPPYQDPALSQFWGNHCSTPHAVLLLRTTVLSQPSSRAKFTAAAPCGALSRESPKKPLPPAPSPQGSLARAPRRACVAAAPRDPRALSGGRGAPGARSLA